MAINKLLYLCKIIDLAQDILPYRMVLLHASIGTGKIHGKILAKHTNGKPTNNEFIALIIDKLQL